MPIVEGSVEVSGLAVGGGHDGPAQSDGAGAAVGGHVGGLFAPTQRCCRIPEVTEDLRGVGGET
ncbi:hypothetical protein [Saccharopolyspora spinosa]|uniref:hypothetical protein n=1 Tax=Saccharopolyspora spinosa TaxID=60894 RepID=UPI000C6F11FB